MKKIGEWGEEREEEGGEEREGKGEMGVDPTKFGRKSTPLHAVNSFEANSD